MNNIDIRKRMVLFVLGMGLLGGALGYAVGCQDGASCKLNPTLRLVAIAQGVGAGWGSAIATSLPALVSSNASESIRRKKGTK